MNKVISISAFILILGTIACGGKGAQLNLGNPALVVLLPPAFHDCDPATDFSNGRELIERAVGLEGFPSAVAPENVQSLTQADCSKGQNNANTWFKFKHQKNDKTCTVFALVGNSDSQLDSQKTLIANRRFAKCIPVAQPEVLQNQPSRLSLDAADRFEADIKYPQLPVVTRQFNPVGLSTFARQNFAVTPVNSPLRESLDESALSELDRNEQLTDDDLFRRTSYNLKLNHLLGDNPFDVDESSIQNLAEPPFRRQNGMIGSPKRSQAPSQNQDYRPEALPLVRKNAQIVRDGALGSWKHCSNDDLSLIPEVIELLAEQNVAFGKDISSEHIEFCHKQVVNGMRYEVELNIDGKYCQVGFSKPPAGKISLNTSPSDKFYIGVPMCARLFGDQLRI